MLWGTGGLRGILWDAINPSAGANPLPKPQDWGSPWWGNAALVVSISKEGGSGRGWAPHPDSHLLLDPVAEIFLDQLAAGAGAEGQVALQGLRGG